MMIRNRRSRLFWLCGVLACAVCRPAVAGEGNVLRVRLLFDGRPLSETTAARPSLWFRNDDEGRQQEVAGEPAPGDLVEVAELPDGRYTLTAYVDDGAPNPDRRRGHPGDL